ncbi:MAG TPA: serine hydrolase [Ignavibacteria bacterium]|nr:serine hydrolase [Ignavibacteria bacterium]
MNKIKSKIIITLFLTIPAVVSAQLNGITEENKFSEIINEAYSKGVFSGNVMIVKDGKTSFEISIGDADYEIKKPNSSETKFETGSITKFFVKTLAHQLEEENKINFSDKLGKYLTGFSTEISENVTIRQLADHSSGFGDFFGDTMNSDELNNAKSISDVLKVIQNEKLQFTPGSKVQYSNSGYVVLAAVIEKVCGKSLEKILKEKIFDKAGMDNTGFKVTVTNIDGKAKGYLSNQLGPKQDNSDMNLIGAGAGGVYSTTGDMNRFAQSLINDNKLLSDEGKVRLFNSPLFPVQYNDWNEFLSKGRFAIAGGAPGISAVFGINMEKKYVMVVLSNFDIVTAEEVSQRLSAVLNNREVKPFTPPPAQIIYDIIKKKGADNFTSNYKEELSSAGIDIDNDMILLFAGREFLRENDAENAIALYSVYTKEFPSIVVAWNDLGDAYLMINEKDKAKKCYEQALKIRPENKRAKDSILKLG